MSEVKPEEIRARRKNLGLSQATVGRRLGVRQATISFWESGKRSPTDEQAALLVTVLGSEGTPELGDVSAARQAFGEWLSSTRLERKLSRSDLASMSGISAPQIFNIETGRTANPRSSTRAQLEAALGEQAPNAVVAAVKEESEIRDVGQFVDFDPHDSSDYPDEPGVYVFYDISDRPIYIGETQNIGKRIRTDHVQKFWYRTPIVEKASYVRVDDRKLRRQLEDTMIKFLKSNAVVNRRQVDR